MRSFLLITIILRISFFCYLRVLLVSTFRFLHILHSIFCRLFFDEINIVKPIVFYDRWYVYGLRKEKAHARNVNCF